MRLYKTVSTNRSYFIYKIINIMENLKLELTLDIFKKFTLSAEEMITVRGGEIDPVIKTTPPPVKI